MFTLIFVLFALSALFIGVGMALTTRTYQHARLEPYVNPDLAKTESVMFVASQSIAKGTVLGVVTATKKFKIYNAGNSDGSEVAEAIAQYTMKTDANGLVTYGDGGDDAGGTFDSGPVYTRGEFLASEITGLSGAAQTRLEARGFKFHSAY